MKRMLLIISVLFATNCIAQTKKDNTIILPGFIETSKIKGVLFQNGYSIISDDSSYISTSSKEINKVSMSVKLMILKTDTATFIKGLTKSTVNIKIFGSELESDYAQLSFMGMKGSPYRRAWEEMDKIAKLISPNVGYIKQ